MTQGGDDTYSWKISGRLRDLAPFQRMEWERFLFLMFLIACEKYVEGVLALERYVPKTRFVMDRLRETSWENRKRIGDLVSVEKLVLRGRKREFHEHMVSNILHRTYFVEWQCIEREIKNGEYTSPEQFKRLVREKEEKARDQLERYRQEKLQREKEEQAKDVIRREKWVEMGGLH